MTILVFVLQILGALGVFLYGMKVMSEGIQRTAGDRMRKVMATMTHNRFSGVLTGLVTTGLLTLIESIGVIMGANLGTTLTAWIIAMVGKFSLSKIAIPIIGMGLPVFFIGKGRWKSFGEVLIGFGLLFYGLHLLKESVPDVKSMLASTDPAVIARAESIRAWIENLSGHGYGSILVFLMLGILLTLIVQSSSAAMAITVTLAIQGWIGFDESAAIVLGENIGTTVTAWLAAIGTAVNAKRAARAHFLFNVIGVCWMMIAFYFFVDLVHFLGNQLPQSFRTKDHSSDVGFHLAIFHSLFNFTNICLLVGFVPLIAKVVTRWIPTPPDETEDTHRLRFISQSMLDVGELNLPEAESATRELAQLTRTMFDGYVAVFKNPDQDLSDEVHRLKRLEDQADVLTHDITEYLVRTSAAEISPENARSITRMLRIVAELEEMSDAIYRLVQITQRKYSKKRDFSDAATADVLSFSEKVSEVIGLCGDVLARRPDDAQLERARTLERETDSLRKSHNKRAMKRMAEPGGVVKTEMLTIDMNNQFEQIANHAKNVVETAYYDHFEERVPDKYDNV